MRAMLTMAVLVAVARPQVEAPPAYSYGAASVELPPEVPPARAIGLWTEMTTELRLGTMRADDEQALAIGDWLSRPHVCAGSVRYHAAVSAARTLRLVIVAECHGGDVTVSRAARGLAEELARKLGAKAHVRAVDVKDVPERLWDARAWAGATVPPTAAPSGGADAGR